MLNSPVVLAVKGEVTTTLSSLGIVQLTSLTELPSGAAPAVKLERGALLTGVCTDLSRFRFEGPATATLACKPARTAPPPSPLAPLREFVPPTVPRVLSPRATYVRGLTWIEWRPVSDRTSFLVQVLNEQFQPVWSTHVDHTFRTRYPERAPKLLPGLPYTVRVTAGDQSSKAERSNLSFTLLSSEGQAQVKRAEAAVRALEDVSELERRFLLALVLRRFQLRAEAIEMLRSPAAAAFVLELGKTYLEVGLFDLAAVSLRKARSLVPADSYCARESFRLLTDIGEG